MSLTKASYSMITGAPVNVFDYMTEAQKTDVSSGAGLLDVTDAVQAAISSSRVANVYFPPGVYRVTQCLDNTNGYRNLYGAPGAVTVKIKSESTDYVIDNTGTNWGVIQGIEIESNSARVGVYYNRSNTVEGAYSQYNVLRNVRFELGTDPAANGGVGRVAYYNRSAELGLIENCQFHTDTPAILTDASNATFLPIYTTEGAIASMTCVEFNKCTFFSYTTAQYAIRLQAATITFTSCYIGSDTAAPSPVHAIFASTIDGCSLQFHIETYEQAMVVTDVCQNSYLNFYLMVSSNQGSIQLENGNVRQSSFIGNNVLVKTGDAQSLSNYGVFSSMNQNYVYITSNNVNASGGIGTPIYYAATTLFGTSNSGNTESSPIYYRADNVSQACVYGANVANGVSFVLDIPTRTKLVKVVMGYAVKTGSDYHSYQYTIPVWDGVAQDVSVASLGSSGSNNDFTHTLVGNTLTISTNNQTGSGTAVYEVTTHYL